MRKMKEKETRKRKKTDLSAGGALSATFVFVKECEPADGLDDVCRGGM